LPVIVAFGLQLGDFSNCRHLQSLKKRKQPGLFEKSGIECLGNERLVARSEYLEGPIGQMPKIVVLSAHLESREGKQVERQRETLCVSSAHDNIDEWCRLDTAVSHVT
jgi:hypothetical protein